MSKTKLDPELIMSAVEVLFPIVQKIAKNEANHLAIALGLLVIPAKSEDIELEKVREDAIKMINSEWFESFYGAMRVEGDD